MNCVKETRLPWLLATLMLGVLAGLLLRPQSSPVFPAAQAQYATGQRIYPLGSDQFFVTTSEQGDAVHLWYFERSGAKRESRVYYVSSADLQTGPAMPK